VLEWHDTGRVYIALYRTVNRRRRSERPPAYFDGANLPAHRPEFYTPDVPEFPDEEQSDGTLLTAEPPSMEPRSPRPVAVGRAGTAAMLFVGLALSASACATPGEPRMIVMFVDGSCSVKDVRPYADAWRRVVASLQPGDRIVLGRVAQGIYSEYRPVVDKSLPASSGLLDNSLVVERKVARERAALDGRFSDVLEEPCSQKTPILDTLSLAEKVFGSDSRKKRLLLGSDMLEDGDRYVFERMLLAPPVGNAIIVQRRTDGLLPNLTGVKVYVVGASAASAVQARRVEAFWAQYFTAVGADFDPLRYGPVLVDFEGPAETAPAAEGGKSRGRDIPLLADRTPGTR
jgi:hypothetical protein